MNRLTALLARVASHRLRAVMAAAAIFALFLASGSAGIPPDTLQITKTGSLDLGGNGTLEPGDVINYSFLVENTGMLFIESIAVSDNLVSPIMCPSGNPIPNLNGMSSETCTGSYMVTQADIDAGVVNNTASAEGVIPEVATVSDTDEHSQPLPQRIELEVVKQATGLVAPGVLVVGPGDIVFNYTFEVTNTGNVTVNNISVTDDVVAMISCPSGNPIPTLAPGDSETCTGSYGPDQADFDNGSVFNTVTAAGITALNVMVSDTDQNTEVLTQVPDIEIVKAGSLDLGGNGILDVGDLIHYTFEVQNTGNLTLTNISVTDDLVSPVTCPSGNPIPSLASNDSETCTGSYAVTALDILSGQVSNTAMAEGNTPGEGTVSDSDGHVEDLPGTILPEPEVAIPLLDEWGLALLALMFTALGWWRLRT